MATPKKRSAYGQKALELAQARADVIDEVGKRKEAIDQLRDRFERELAAAEQAYVDAIVDATEMWSVKELREEFDIPVNKAVREEIRRRKEAAVPKGREVESAAPVAVGGGDVEPVGDGES